MGHFSRIPAGNQNRGNLASLVLYNASQNVMLTVFKKTRMQRWPPATFLWTFGCIQAKRQIRTKGHIWTKGH